MWFFVIPLTDADRTADLRDWLADECVGAIGWGTSKIYQRGKPDKEIAIDALNGPISYRPGLISRCMLALTTEHDAVSLMLHFPDAEQTGDDFRLACYTYP